MFDEAEEESPQTALNNTGNDVTINEKERIG